MLKQIKKNLFPPGLRALAWLCLCLASWPAYADNVATDTAYIEWSPQAWPAEAAWVPYTLNGNPLQDNSTADNSNGGTAPQNYVNYIGNELGLPSVYYYFDGTTVFFRSRMEGFPVAYKAASAIRNTDPWASYQWNMLLDVNGDGLVDFGAQLNGSTGEPGNPQDDIDVIWNNSGINSLNYEDNPNIHRIFSVKSSRPYTSGSGSGEAQQFDGNGSLVSSGSAWPDGRKTSAYDFGMTRGIATSGEGYFIDVQFPITALDASAHGGPAISTTTPLALAFSTANSLQNPFQKDFVYPGSFIASDTGLVPTGDTLTLGAGIVQAPQISSVVANGCNLTDLQADIMDTVILSGSSVTSTVQAADFYYWQDTNANGLADDAGSSWMLIGPGSNSSANIGRWSTTWDSTVLAQGQHLIKVVASDGSNNGDSYNQSPSVNAVFNNTCGLPPFNLSKTVSPTEVSAGSNVTYTISVNNPQSTALSLNQVSDTLPSGFTLLSTDSVTINAAATSFTAGGNATVPIWSGFGGAIPAGGKLEIVLTASIDINQPSGIYQNQVSASTPSDTVSTGNTAAVNIGPATLAIKKIVDKNIANTGDILDYTIVFSNPSTQTSTNTLLTDTLPVGTSYVEGSLSLNGTPLTTLSDADAGEVVGGVITVRAGDLPPTSADQTITFQTTVDNNFAAANPVVNTAELTSDQVVVAVSDSANTVINASNLDVSKTADITSAWVGDEITFSITYSNSGQADALNTVLSDTLPAGLTYVPGSASNSPTISGQTLTWSLGALSALSFGNTLSYRASVDTGVSNGVNVNNNVVLSADNTASASDSVNITFSKPAANPIRISKTSSVESLVEGSNTTASYTVTIFNDSTTDSLSLTEIQDVLPTSGFTFNSVSTASSDIDNAPTVSGNTLTWTSGSNLSPNTIAAGGSLSLVYTVTIAAPTYTSPASANTYSNDVTLTGTLNGSAVNESASAAVFVTPDRDISVYKSVNGSTNITLDDGDTANYKFTITRTTGFLTNPDNIFSDTLEDGQNYIVGSFDGGGSFIPTFFNGSGTSITPVADANGVDVLVRRIDWTTSTNKIPSGTTTVGFAVKIDATTAVAPPLTNVVSSSSTRVNDSNQTNINLLGSGPPPTSNALSLNKSVDLGAAPIGATLTYSLDFSNTGTGTSTNTILRDSLPANTTYVANSTTLNGNTVADVGSASPLFDAGGMGVQGSADVVAGEISAGGSGSVTFQVSINTPSAQGVVTEISNSGSIASSESPGNVSSNTVQTIVSQPDLTVSKSADTTLLNAGESVVYTIEILNTGTAAASNVVVTDVLPVTAYYNYQASSATTSQGTVGESADTITANLGNLAPGATAQVSFTMTAANTGIPEGTTATSNNASIALNEFSSNYTTNTVNVDINGSPLLSLGKVINALNGSPVSNPSSAEPGDVLTYTLTYGNTGGSDATSVSLADPIPANTNYVAGSLQLNSSPVTDDTDDADLGGYDALNNKIVFNFGTIAGGTSNQTIRFDVVVDTPMPAGITTLSNVASLSAANAANATAQVDLDINAAPLLNVSKSAPAVILSPGATDIIYTLNFSNTGNADASSVLITDVLPGGSTYVASTLNGGAGGSESPVGTVSFNIPSLAAGESGSATITVNAPQGSYTNTADIDSTETTPLTSNTTVTEIKNSVTGSITSATSIIAGNPITVTVDDADLKGESLIFVTVVNGASGETESIGLAETGSNTGIFTGTLETAYDPLAGSDNNNLMFAQPGDALTASYADANDASGNPASATGITNVVPGTLATLSASDPIILGDSISLTLTDPDLNQDSSLIETYQVLTTNTTTGETELLTYIETASNTGIFAATVNTVDTAGAGGNNTGSFNVQGGDQLVSTYEDNTTLLGPSETVTAITNVNNLGISLSGKVYADSNHNSQLDGSESGTGLTLYIKLVLSSSSPAGPAIAAVSVDAATGAYTFPVVSADTYLLILDDNNTLSDVTPALPAGWIGTEADEQTISNVVVGTSPVNTLNIGLYNGSRINGFVFADTGNTTGTANNGILDGDETGLSGLKITVSNAAGDTLYDTATTSGDGSYTAWLPVGATGTKVVASNRNGYLSTGADTNSTAGSYDRNTDSLSFINIDGTVYNNVNFGDVAANTLDSDGIQSALPGSVVFFPHTFTAGSAGDVSFSVSNTPNPANSTWNPLIYRDSNCNATIDSGEPLLNTSLTVAANENICVLVKDSVPANAPIGAQNQILLQANFTYTNANPALTANLTRTDLTQVGEANGAGLVLSKTVDKATALPGDTLIYTITYRNNGSKNINSLVMRDATPAYTSYLSAACGTLPANLSACNITSPAIAETGSIEWQFTGTLAPGMEGSVSYQVLVDSN